MAQMTELDRRLQEVATKNWAQFVALIGADSILAAKICMLRQEKKSYGEISVRLGVTERKARYWCDECGDGKESTGHESQRT